MVHACPSRRNLYTLDTVNREFSSRPARSMKSFSDSNIVVPMTPLLLGVYPGSGRIIGGSYDDQKAIHSRSKASVPRSYIPSSMVIIYYTPTKPESLDLTRVQACKN